MSLQVWLPLNGHVNNYGMLGNEAITVASTPSYVDSGRAGKALAGGGLTLTANATAKTLNNKEVTIAFWIYPLGTTSGIIFGNNSVRRYTLFQYPTANDIHWSWANETGDTTIIKGVRSGAMPTKAWTHICFVYKNPTCTLYINGVASSATSGNISCSTYETATSLIAANSGRYISDFRLYDNALSLKEVKLLAQGLMLHYTCNDIFSTRSCNLYTGDTVEGKPSYSGFTVSKLTDERGYRYSLSYTGTGSNTWYNFNFPSLSSYNVDQKYVFSCKIRKRSGNNVNTLYLRAARISNDYEATATNVLGASDNEWHEYSVIAAMPSTHPRSSTVAPRVEFYTSNLSTSGTSYIFDFDIKDVQLYECDTTGAPVSSQEFIDNIVYDSSGYRNHGKTVSASSPKWCGGSPRYSGCYQFLGAQQIQSIINPITAGTTDFSFSFWYKASSAGTTFTIYTGRTATSGAGIAVFDVDQHFRLDDGAMATFSSYTIPADTWIHVMITRSSSGKKLYINGELKQTISTVGGLTNIGKYATIGASENSDTGVGTGNYLTGYLSDFRIFSSALDATAAKEYYEVSASLINTSTLLLGGELVE